VVTLPLQEKEWSRSHATREDVAVRHKLELVGDEHCSCCRDALASAAHELKTPLAIMGGYLHLLLAEKLGRLTSPDRSAHRDAGQRRALSNFIQNS